MARRWNSSDGTARPHLQKFVSAAWNEYDQCAIIPVSQKKKQDKIKQKTVPCRVLLLLHRHRGPCSFFLSMIRVDRVFFGCNGLLSSCQSFAGCCILTSFDRLLNHGEQWVFTDLNRAPFSCIGLNWVLPVFTGDTVFPRVSGVASLDFAVSERVAMGSSGFRRVFLGFFLLFLTGFPRLVPVRIGHGREKRPNLAQGRRTWVSSTVGRPTSFASALLANASAQRPGRDNSTQFNESHWNSSFPARFVFIYSTSAQSTMKTELELDGRYGRRWVDPLSGGGGGKKRKVKNSVT